MTPSSQVTVIVPLFNSERTIRATLCSILAQTYYDIDILVIDDGSTDASMAIVEELQGKDSRLRCVRQVNGGAATARNTGAARTQAPFLAFCDADDLWAPRKLELQVERMHAGGEAMAMVYCWFARIDQNDNVLSIDRSGGEGKLFMTLLRRNVVGNGSTPLFRKTAFDLIGGFSSSLSPAEDLAIYLAMAEHYEIGVVPQILVGYRSSDTSLSANEMAVYLSTCKVMEPYMLRLPERRAAISLHLRGVLMWQIIRAFQRRRYLVSMRLLQLDLGLIRNIFQLYLPEYVASAWRGSIKDSWQGLLGRRRHQTFGVLTESRASSNPVRRRSPH